MRTVCNFREGSHEHLLLYFGSAEEAADMDIEPFQVMSLHLMEQKKNRTWQGLVYYQLAISNHVIAQHEPIWGVFHAPEERQVCDFYIHRTPRFNRIIL